MRPLSGSRRRRGRVRATSRRRARATSSRARAHARRRLTSSRRRWNGSIGDISNPDGGYGAALRRLGQVPRRRRRRGDCACLRGDGGGRPARVRNAARDGVGERRAGGRVRAQSLRARRARRGRARRLRAAERRGTSARRPTSRARWRRAGERDGGARRRGPAPAAAVVPGGVRSARRSTAHAQLDGRRGAGRAAEDATVLVVTTADARTHADAAAAFVGAWLAASASTSTRSTDVAAAVGPERRLARRAPGHARVARARQRRGRRRRGRGVGRWRAARRAPAAAARRGARARRAARRSRCARAAPRAWRGEPGRRPVSYEERLGARARRRRRRRRRHGRLARGSVESGPAARARALDRACPPRRRRG